VPLTNVPQKAILKAIMPQNKPEIRYIAAESPHYPALLREIPYPPEGLNIWSKSEKISQTPYYLSVVGTRKCSGYGEEIARKIITGLAPYGFTIVSGLAIGIDTIAHKASLENNMPTVAVVGSGLAPEVLYPARNKHLAEEIVARGGAIISEYEYEMKAAQWTFPQRNRIISGLSPATLVIEAPEKSGALVTARFALDQNRDVLAVPGSPLAPNSKGTNKLIKEGAALVESAEDILHVYGIETGSEKSALAVSFENISPEEKIILDALIEPMDIDSVIRKSKMPSHTVQSIVVMMEMRGMIKKAGNNYFKNVY